MEGKLHFKIDWASLIFVEGNLPFLLCFTLYLRPISKYKPRGGEGLFFEGRFNGGFLRYELGGLYMEGLIFGIFWYVTVLERYHISLLLKPS